MQCGHLRLLIWQIEEIDVRKSHIWRISQGFWFFWSNQSQRLEMAKVIPNCFVSFWLHGPPGSPLICILFKTIPGDNICAVPTLLYLVSALHSLWKHCYLCRLCLLWILPLLSLTTYHCIIGKLVNSPLQQRPIFKIMEFFGWTTNWKVG